MYQCHTQIYFIGRQRAIFERIKEMPPLNGFTHAFLESGEPEAALIEQADMILADLEGLDARAAALRLAAGKRAGTELIVLADKEQTAALADAACGVKDIWTAPLSEEEMRFRFLRWQESWKLSRACIEAEREIAEKTGRWRCCLKPWTAA